MNHTFKIVKAKRITLNNKFAYFQGESQFIIIGVYRSYYYNNNRFIISLDEPIKKYM